MNLPAPERMIVADAGPLIGLAKIERLELLKRLAPAVVVPAPVWHEVVVRGGDRAEVRRIIAELQDNICEPDRELYEAYRLQVDSGEAGAMAIAAKNPNCILLMDDARGRRLARVQGFRFMGTLGLLLRAKRCGFIEAVRPEVLALIRAGVFLDDTTIQSVLLAADETV